MATSFLKILVGILPYGLVWKFQKQQLKQFHRRDLIDIAGGLHPTTIHDFLLEDEKAKTALMQPHRAMLEKWRRFYSQCENAQEALSLLTPSEVCNVKKVRIGGPADGGYVMLEPGNNGIAYSFGVSTSAPWDLDMAQRGFSVFQYDGTVEKSPDVHPKIHFNKFNIGSGNTMTAMEKSIRQIINHHNYESEKDIILQIDIEGAEWGALEELELEDLLRFKQIIIELHSVNPFAEDFPRKLAVLKKIRTHFTPYHIHANNNGCRLDLEPGQFGFPDLLEVSYARTADFTFCKCDESFPTLLDSPNDARKEDCFLGTFSDI